MENTQDIDIGSEVTFIHQGVTLEGRVVGSEFVERDWRRRSGQWFSIQISDRSWLPIHESAVGAVVGEEIEVS